MLLSSKIFIYNDCRPITQALKRASTNNKINEWILRLQEFDYEIFHVSGKVNILADTLSRVPRELLIRLEEEENKVWNELNNRNTNNTGLSKVITGETVGNTSAKGNLIIGTVKIGYLGFLCKEN
jgi:hypothetical protein